MTDKPRPKKPNHPDTNPDKEDDPAVPRRLPDIPGAPDREPVEIPPDSPREVPIKDPKKPDKNKPQF